jgi:hypothetical protein
LRDQLGGDEFEKTLGQSLGFYQAETERRRADRELTEADRDHRREQATLYQRQAESLRQRIKAGEKSQAEAVKLRDEIEERMRQW